MHEVEIRAKSLEEARKTAAFQLGVNEDEIEMEVVQEPVAAAQNGFDTYHIRARIRHDAFSPHGPDSGGEEAPAPSTEPEETGMDLSRFSLAADREPASPGQTDEAEAEVAPPGTEPEPEQPAAVEAPAHEGEAADREYDQGDEDEEEDEGEPKHGVAERAKEFLEGLLRLLELQSEVIIVHVGGAEVELEIQGDDLGFLIGRYGACLDALQLLAAAASNRGLDEGARILLDAEGYRERRREFLERLALSTADTVRRTGRPVDLPNLRAHERRVVHLTLRDDPDVETHSEGEGSRRCLVVAPRRKRGD